MSPKKKDSNSNTSTDSSSGTGSDSNSNSSSDSSSGSGSDSDSSSSESCSSSSASIPKDSKPEEKNTRRKSQDSSAAKTQTRGEVQPQSQQPQKPKEKPAPPAKETRSKASSTATSGNDSSSAEQSVKKALVKKKIAQKPATQPVSGGKVPPSVIKQQQMSHHTPSNGTIGVKPSAGMKAAAQQKHSIMQANKKAMKDKKKSDSTENSSESEDDKQKKKEKKPTTTSLLPRPGTKAPKQVRPRGRPRKNPPPAPKPVVEKPTLPSSTTSSTDSTTDSDNSDSESTASSVKTLEKTPKKSQTPSMSNNIKKDPAKKLTRSSSTRKSKHLVGKYTDTESDSTKRSMSRSPVKKTALFASTKTTSKKLTDTKPTLIKQEQTPEKRRCPLEECNSLGHLGGVHDTHFTIEACPMYHNLSIADTKQLLVERKKREEERKKGVEMFEKSKKVVLPEQKLYQQKVREARSKFKSPTPSSKDKKDKENFTWRREPNLKGIVPDYDFQLFRQAQAAASENVETELKLLPASRGTKYITMGKHCMQVWYQSPYPEDVARLPKLYLCEFCLRYQKCAIGMKRHSIKCMWRHPPGDEIYRKGKLGVWQIDGKRHKQYCQHLCLLAKFFLDHKTLYYDVEPFLFYVMTISDADGCHTIGYFSKEKNSFLNYNVSCILTLPPYQRKGYGRLLIDFSYLLTRVEGKIGSPEKPLSDLGLISYRSYWKDVLLNYLCTRTGNTLSIKDISQEMAINSYDIVSTLQALGMMKYWKGKHIILKKQDVLEEYQERLERRGNFPKIDPACLRWTPFVPPQPGTPS